MPQKRFGNPSVAQPAHMRQDLKVCSHTEPQPCEHLAIKLLHQSCCTLAEIVSLLTLYNELRLPDAMHYLCFVSDFPSKSAIIEADLT